jgi:hypothetical protein
MVVTGNATRTTDVGAHAAARLSVWTNATANGATTDVTQTVVVGTIGKRIVRGIEIKTGIEMGKGTVAGTSNDAASVLLVATENGDVLVQKMEEDEGVPNIQSIDDRPLLVPRCPTTGM